jgi:anti-sigma B factor antagonist
MSFKLEDRDACTIVHIEASRLDSLNHEGLTEEIGQVIDSGKKNLILDLSKVGFMDSSGLRFLINTNNHLKKSKGRLVNFGAKKNVETVITMTGLQAVLEFASSENEAVERFSAS